MSVYLVDDFETSFIANVICGVCSNELVLGERKSAKEMALALRAMNTEALVQRYGDETEDDRRYCGIGREFTYYKNFSATWGWEFDFVEVAESFLYQCCEGDVDESELYKQVEDCVRGIKNRIYWMARNRIKEDMKRCKCVSDFEKRYNAWRNREVA